MSPEFRDYLAFIGLIPFDENKFGKEEVFRVQVCDGFVDMCNLLELVVGVASKPT
jgi:hypothetical protein